MASSTERASTARLTNSSDVVAGRKVNAFSGSKIKESTTTKTEKNFIFNQHLRL
jgi:hypothetical protein